MRSAAFSAGLIASIDDTRLAFVLEPEAATALVRDARPCVYAFECLRCYP